MILYHGTNQDFGDIDLAPNSVCNATPPASITRVPAMSSFLDSELKTGRVK